jgi:hypothetical protein
MGCNFLNRSGQMYQRIAKAIVSSIPWAYHDVFFKGFIVKTQSRYLFGFQSRIFFKIVNQIGKRNWLKKCLQKLVRQKGLKSLVLDNSMLLTLRYNELEAIALQRFSLLILNLKHLRLLVYF